MAKKPTITTVTSGYYGRQALNTNFENIRDQFDNTLSLDGSTPNSMNADFDLNGNDLLNGKDGEFTNSLTVKGVDILDALGGSVGPATVFKTTNRFTGDGSTVSFTLSKTPASRANTDVFINGIYQQKDTYTVSGTTLTFSEAPPAAVFEVVIYEAIDVGTLDASSVSTSDGQDVQAKFDQAAYPVEWTPEYFGAIGDGITDDTTAIMAWAAAVDGGVGILPDNKHYLTSDEIVFSANNTRILGGGTIEQTTWGLSGIQSFGDDFSIYSANIITTQTKSLLSTGIGSRFLGDVARARSSALYLAGHRAWVGSAVSMSGFVHGITLAGQRVWRENITVSSATTTTLPLDAADARDDQEYVGAVIRLLNVIDSPIRTITAYDQGTNTITVDEPFSSAPNAAGVYYVIWMGRQEDVEIGNVSIDLTDFGIVPTWVDNLTIGQVSAYNGEQSQGADAPPHTIYVTGDSKRLRSRNIVVDDCLTEDSYGTAYKFRGVDGLALGVMQAHQARGIGAIEHCVGVVAAGWTGTGLGALAEGQPTGVFVVGGANVHVGDVTAIFDPDYTGGVAAVDYRPVGLLVQNDLDDSGDYETATDVTYGTVIAEWAGTAQSMFGVVCSQQAGSTTSPATRRVRGGSVVVKAAGTATAFRVSDGVECMCADVIALASGTNIAVQFDAAASGCTAFVDADVSSGSVTNNGTGCVVFDRTLDPATLPLYKPTGQLSGTSFGLELGNQGGTSHGLRGDAFAGMTHAARWRQSGTGGASAFMVWSYGDSTTEWVAINGNGSVLRFGNATSMRIQNAAGSTVAEILANGGLRIGGSSGPEWLSGSGSPEGVVAAPVGSMFSRTDGGATTSLYVKESGTGNTGWVAK